MPTHRIGLPDGRADRALHLRGLNDALTGKPKDGPVLSPEKEIYEQGYNVGADMRERNHMRRKALQENRSGLEHRIRTAAEIKAAKKLPPLP